MNGKKILIVDDGRVVKRTFHSKLTAEGFSVTMVEDGAGAMSALRQEQPDLVLLDVTYPPDVAHGGGASWDGFTLLAWLRRLDETKDVPVVLMGGDDSPEQIQRARTAGAAGFLPKPINDDTLMAVIRRLLKSNET